MPTAVFDSNILLRMVLPSQRDPLADQLWQYCADNGIDILIPSLGVSEAMAQIRRHVSSGRLTRDDGDAVFTELTTIVNLVRIETVQLGAWNIAKRFNRPDTYDSEFFALAERVGADLWTADDRFVNAMGQQRPEWVKRLREFQPQP